MKKKLIVLLGLVLSYSALAASDTATVNANTVNLTAATVNITPSLSQQSLIAEYKHPWWINVGAGLTTGFGSNDPVNPGFDVSANFQPTAHQVISLRSAGADFIGGDYYDVGVMYGLITRNANGYLSASAGVGPVFFENDFLKDHENKTVLGAPIEAQAFWTPVANFGLGLIGFMNVNTEHSYYGMVLALQLANLVPI